MLRKSFVGIGMCIMFMCAVVAPQSLYAQCVPPPSGMVAWWPLDEQAGATIVEDIVGSHDGTPSPGPIGIVGSNDGPWTCGGKVGDALWFWQNGVYRRYVSVGSQPDIEFGTTDFSIDAWVYITQYSGTDLQPIVEKMQYNGTTPEVGYRFYLESGTLSFTLAWGLGTATTIQAPSQISQAVWHHVAVTVNRDPGGATVNLYIDGSPVGSPSSIPGLTTQSIANTEALIMGAIAQPQPPPVNYLNIYIDELEMFNRELLQSEVQSIYDADSFGKCKPSCVPPPANMTAWWPLDETSGPTAEDIAGYANNGTWMNSPTPVTGKVDGALSFNGSNSVDVPDHTELNFGTEDFSIDLWIKSTDASGTRTVMDKRTGSLPNATGYALYLYNGKPGLGIFDGAGYTNFTSTEFVADGSWHHVAATVDRDNSLGLLFYVDGNHVSTHDPTVRQGDLTNTAPFVMARNLIDPGYTFAGTLDEVELFNRVLDSLEVYSIWNADSLGKCKDTCHADGDANNDAVGLTTDDLAYLGEFIDACGPAPIPLYSCDLNGDGVVDPADLQLYNDYFVYGISVFDPYGGYPVLCPCNPDPAPVPDTVNIFGMEHISCGTACFDTTGGLLTVSRIWPEPIDTLVDANGDTIIVVAHPDKAESGGGPYGSSMSNLEDAGIAWSADYEQDTTLEVGATLEAEVYGIVNGDSDQIVASAVQTKQADDSWALGVKAAVNSYSVEAYLRGELVWSASGIAASDQWFQVGRLGKSAKAESGGGPYGSSMSNLEDAGIIAIERESEDTLTWTWESQGVSDLEVDQLIVEGDCQVEVGELTYVVQYAMNIPSFTITSESQTFDYGEIAITPLGNAIVTLVETTLVVSNIGPCCIGGVDAEAVEKDGEWSIVAANPDPSGTFPVGAGLETEFFFATPTQPNSFSMAISMTKAALNTWDLAVQSAASVCSVKAFNNGSPVFSGIDNGTTGLGYIFETAKGVYPVGYNGASTNKPASVVVSSGFDFTDSPDGVQWTWLAHGVSDLQIDSLSISTEVSDTSLFGVTHVTMCGDNGAKSDPISFTILDIKVTPHFMLGDVNGDELIDLGDVLYIISYLYKGGPEPAPLESGDCTCDGVVDLGDILYLISYLYKGGPPPEC